MARRDDIHALEAIKMCAFFMGMSLLMFVLGDREAAKMALFTGLFFLALESFAQERRAMKERRRQRERMLGSMAEAVLAEEEKRLRLIWSLSIAAMLVIAPLDWPYWYYVLLRIAVFFSASLLWSAGGLLWQIGAVVIAILYNPFVFVQMDKSSWVVADVVTALVFLCAIPAFLGKKFPRPGRIKSPYCSDAYDRYLEYLGSYRSPSYCDKVLSRLKRVERELGCCAWHEISYDEMRAWLATKGWTERTVMEYLDTMGAFCEWARRHGVQVPGWRRW